MLHEIKGRNIKVLVIEIIIFWEIFFSGYLSLGNCVMIIIFSFAFSSLCWFACLICPPAIVKQASKISWIMLSAKNFVIANWVSSSTFIEVESTSSITLEAALRPRCAPIMIIIDMCHAVTSKTKFLSCNFTGHPVWSDWDLICQTLMARYQMVLG